MGFLYITESSIFIHSLKTSSIKTPFPRRVSVPSSFVSLFIFYILSYLPSKTMGCFSGCLMSAASNQKLFCELCSPFNCSFDEFVGEKVVSPFYSSAILYPLFDKPCLLIGVFTPCTFNIIITMVVVYFLFVSIVLYFLV